MNEWLGMHDPGGGIFCPDCLDACDGGSDELMFDGGASVFAVRMDIRLLTGGPGQERDFVDRGIELDPIAVVCDEARHIPAVTGKPIYETRTQNVQVIGPPV